ncbi:MAG: hypothetical protein JXA71_18995 [Chitinispirillaceae bacterium]|nr:hypothetical protein [Chitinispirillaceae bacterium]
MPGTIRYAAFFLLAVFSLPNTPLFHSSCEESTDAAGIVDSIARVSGMDDLTGITQISFTFSARSPRHKIKRQWQWFPQTDEIIFKGNDPSGKKNTVSYSRKAIGDMRSGSPALTVDTWFTHDIYWLLFPYFLAHDPQKRMVISNSAVMPLSGRWATGIMVEYYRPDPKRPGEKFEVFIDSTYLIQEWVVYPAQSHRAVAANKWKNYRQAGPFMVALDRPARNSKGMRVTFSGVTVTRENE